MRRAYGPRRLWDRDADPIHVVGGGLAGSEAAWQVAEMGVPVVLHEMRPVVGTFAHQTDGLAELVCSNSFRSDDDEQNAVGLLHWEMRAAGGLVIATADRHALPAGSALAIDREPFSRRDHRPPRGPPARHHRPRRGRRPAAGRLVERHRRHRPADLAGARRGDPRADRRDARSPSSTPSPRSCTSTPSTSPRPGSSRATTRARPRPSAPPTSTARWTATSTRPSSTRCSPPRRPSSRTGRRDTPYFEGCLPIEVMAERGRETLRFGPLKPVGLTNPHAPDVKPYAVVQLRRDNALGTLYNLVGFQTKMKHGAQTEVFRMIPGLENAAFARLGGIHRNTFLNSPRLLDGRAAAAGRPAPALRRPDHRRRGLRRERGDGPARRPPGRRRAPRPPARPAAARRPRSARSSATSPAAPRPRPSSR